jgi:hypothetical protein
MQIIASPDGTTTNDGTVASPVSLQEGLDRLQPGDVLLLRGGTYVGNSTMTEREASPEQPIVIRSFDGEHAVLDGATLAEFGAAPNDSWVPVGDGEFRSRNTFPRGEDERTRG